MDKNHTNSLLKLLSKPEMTLLGKFLQSPFFTAKKFLYPLFSELRATDLQPAKSAGAAFTRVFPREPFDRHKWNKALSDLNACIEEFLIVRQVSDDPHLRIQAEVNALFGRHDAGLFQRKVSAILKNLTGKSVRETADSWQLRFWTLKRAASNPLADRTKASGEQLDDLENSLDLYYFISKLQLACNRASQAQVLQLKNDQEVFRQLLEHTKRLDPSGQSALLILYRALLHLLTVPDAPFGQFFALLQTEGPRLERGELESVVLFAFNYCIRCHRQGQAGAFGRYRQVFDWADTQAIWTATAAEDLFLNTGVMFAKSQDSEGFEAFLKKGKSTLPAERHQDAVALLQAYRHFYQSDFDSAALALATVKTRHPRYTLLFHSLKVRNVYEQWLLEPADPGELEQALNSFEDFLQRKDLFAESLQQSYRLMIWFVRKMMQNGKKRALSKVQLKEELKKKQPAARDWLSARIDGLPA